MTTIGWCRHNSRGASRRIVVRLDVRDRLFCVGGELAPITDHAAAAARYAAPAWRLVWGDEFDRPGAPDPAKWNYEQGRVRNREAQFYTTDRRENARVEGGNRVITRS